MNLLTKNQIKILKVFREDIFEELTFKQIKEKSRQKSNNIPLLALREFKKDNLVSMKKTGNVTAYSLNLENNLTLSYLNLMNDIEINEGKVLPKRIMQELQARISKHSNFFILMIFGSYAKGRVTKKSDLDIAVIIEDENSRKEVTPYIETIKRREIIKIDYHIFTEKEFIEMLKTEPENVGKEIYRENVVYYGLIEYLNLIRRVKNGSNI